MFHIVFFFEIQKLQEVSKTIPEKRIYNAKKYIVQLQKMGIKTTTTAVMKNALKYSSMSEGNTCTAEQNLAVLPLRWFSKGLVYFLFVKSFKV